MLVFRLIPHSEKLCLQQAILEFILDRHMLLVSTVHTLYTSSVNRNHWNHSGTVMAVSVTDEFNGKMNIQLTAKMCCV